MNDDRADEWEGRPSNKAATGGLMLTPLWGAKGWNHLPSSLMSRLTWVMVGDAEPGRRRVCMELIEAPSPAELASGARIKFVVPPSGSPIEEMQQDGSWKPLGTVMPDGTFIEAMDAP